MWYSISLSIISKNISNRVSQTPVISIISIIPILPMSISITLSSSIIYISWIILTSPYNISNYFLYPLLIHYYSLLPYKFNYRYSINWFYWVNRVNYNLFRVCFYIWLGCRLGWVRYPLGTSCKFISVG